MALGVSLSLMQSVLALLALILIASVVTSLVYFLLCCLENESQIAAQFFNFLVIGSCLAFIVTLASNGINYIPLYLLAVFVGSIGSIFHQKSSAAPKNTLACFSLMSTVTLLNITVSTVFLEICELAYAILWNIEGQFGFFAGFFVRFLIAAQSITAPFLIWVWKSYRLRPGIDKHLED